MKRLLERRSQLLRRLPPFEEILRGSVVRRLLRCGKPGCRCATGERHPAVYLSVTHAGGRTEQISLPTSLIRRAEQGVANYHAWWEAIEKISAINRELLRRERQAVGSRRVGPRGRQRNEPRAGPARSRRGGMA
jgi:transcriptional regulator NrdR family protein